MFVEAGATTSNQDFETRLHNLTRTRLKHTNTHIHTCTTQKANDIAGQRKDKDKLTFLEVLVLPNLQVPYYGLEFEYPQGNTTEWC